MERAKERQSAPASSRRSEDGADTGANLLYAPLEERFERLTRLACHVLSVPVAVVFLADEDRRWIKSISGWHVSELPNDRALYTSAMEAEGPTIIPDLTKDARTRDYDFVTSAPNLRFYAAYPLLGEHHWPIGSFAVFDVWPRRLSPTEQRSLLDLAELTQRELSADPAARPRDLSLSAKLSIARRENMIDPLTRLWNARGANALIEKALEQSDLTDTPLGLAAFNIDDFRKVNERHGSQAADEVLRGLADRLIGAVRDDDLVFRAAADEFLVLMSNVDAKTGRQIVERVRWTLTEHGVTTVKGDVAISVRAGFALRQPHDGSSVGRLLERARGNWPGGRARARLPRVGSPAALSRPEDGVTAPHSSG